MQVFNATAELAIPVVLPTKEGKGEIKSHAVIADAKRSKY